MSAAQAKSSKPKAAAPLHPPYLQMITEAISALKERGGSSSQAIAKYLDDKYKGKLPSNFRKLLSVQLRHFAKSAKLVKVKNSFKVGPPPAAGEKAPVGRPKKASSTAKKPAAKVAKAAGVKKAASKPAKAAGAKKPAGRPAKAPAGEKKAVTKKPAGRPAKAVKPTAAKPKAAKPAAAAKPKAAKPKSVKKVKTLKSPAKKKAAPKPAAKKART